MLLNIFSQGVRDVSEAEKVLSARTFSETVDHDWQQTDELGIHVVSTFVVGENKLVGAQDYRLLPKFVKQNSVSKK